MPFCPFLYRLALSEAELVDGSVMAWGLQPPSAAPYVDHTEAVGQSDGGQALLGYDQVTLSWDIMSSAEAATIGRLVEDALGTDGEGFLYLTISRANGTNPGPDWIDVMGRPHPPQIAAPPNIAGISDLYHQNVTLVVNNLTILNDPSLYSVE